MGNGCQARWKRVACVNGLRVRISLSPPIMRKWWKVNTVFRPSPKLVSSSLLPHQSPFSSVGRAVPSYGNCHWFKSNNGDHFNFSQTHKTHFNNKKDREIGLFYSIKKGTTFASLDGTCFSTSTSSKSGLSD